MTNAQEVYAKLRQEILAYRLKPGAKLKIADLCEEMGVSNGAVREALSRLSADDLVTARPQRGFIVAEMSRRDMSDLTKARILIENECLAQAMANRDVDWESRIVASYHKLERLPEREPSDPARLSDAWVNAHAEFHNALVANCANTWLLKIREQLYEKSERYRRLSVPLRKIKRAVNAEHKAIMNAALANNQAKATTLMAEHLTLTSDILLASGLLQDE
ncbi:MAG TPA: GntR family transcriptional regulator [Roseiarcus sp.]|nr:GntR family transcriptional regulator [Roseiarcus sp.]